VIRLDRAHPVRAWSACESHPQGWDFLLQFSVSVKEIPMRIPSVQTRKADARCQTPDASRSKSFFPTGVWRLASGVCLIALGLAAPADGQQAAYVSSVGYRVQPTDLKGGGLALSPAGRLAVAHDDASGGATITIYSSLDPAARTVLQMLRAPAGDTFRFFGGLLFRDDDTLLFAENGDMDTVYSGSIGTGEVRALAPRKSLPDVGALALRPGDGLLFAETASGPGQGAVFTVENGSVTPFARGLGAGYLGGLAFDPAGRLYVGDAADPDFSGKPGQVLELGPRGEVRRSVSLAAGGGHGIADLVSDSEGDLIATTGPTITQVRLHAGGSGASGARVSELGRFAGADAFPTSLVYHGTRFEPGSGDGTLLVNGTLTGVGAVFAVAPTAEKLSLPTDFGTRIVAFDGKNGKPSFNTRPELALGPPSSAATPQVPDNSGIVSFGWGGSITLAFDRAILNDPLHPGGYDFILYGNSFYVGGNEHVSYQGPGYVEVGLDLNDNGVPDPGEPFYLLRGRPDPGAPPRFPLPESLFGAIDHRQTMMLGYADVTPTDGRGDPLLPDDPLVDGITPGSAGGDAFDLSWAVDTEGRPVALDHADFIRVTHALNVNHPLFGPSTTEIDAVSLVRPRQP
jgi:hypothetical protein